VVLLDVLSKATHIYIWT